MSTINGYKSYQQYLKEYSTWREDKNLQNAKRQEYLRRNPDAIKDYDLQRTKILLSAVDFMDKSIAKNSDNFGTAFETAANLGLGYVAIGGATLGILVKKIGFVKNNINKIIQKHPKLFRTN